jgi:hypothetical protein
MSEVVSFEIDPRLVYRDEPLPYGGDPDAIDATVAKARSIGGYKAVWTHEGTDRRGDSVYVFNRTVLRDLKRGVVLPSDSM